MTSEILFKLKQSERDKLNKLSLGVQKGRTCKRDDVVAYYKACLIYEIEKLINTGKITHDDGVALYHWYAEAKE